VELPSTFSAATHLSECSRRVTPECTLPLPAKERFSQYSDRPRYGDSPQRALPDHSGWQGALMNRSDSQHPSVVDYSDRIAGVSMVNAPQVEKVPYGELLCDGQHSIRPASTVFATPLLRSAILVPQACPASCREDSGAAA